MKEKRKPWPTSLKMLLLFLATVAVFAIVWFVRLQPDKEQSQQKSTTITTFEECVAAGNPVQESYPPVCMTPDLQRFIGPR